MLNSGANVRNLIFDLGGVILDLSFQRTFTAFARLANLDAEAVAEICHHRPEFNAFEKGDLSEAEFRDALRQLFSTTAADAELDACWNAMLVDIPSERIQLLEKLRSRYRLFLLSNTNSIHARHFNQIVNRNSRHDGLEPLFDKAYYSHASNMRKPDLEIYEYVLNESNLAAHETFFFDDNMANLDSAKQLGISTIHVHHPDLIFTLLNEVQT
jgi:putative hydrolase of the HAD superfamily